MAPFVRGPGDESRWHYRKSAASWVAKMDTAKDGKPRQIVRRWDYVGQKAYYVVEGG